MDRDAIAASDHDPAPSPCRVLLLGRLRVEPGLDAAALGPPKQRELLAALALRPGEVVSHDALAEALWQGAAPRTYAHSLQLYVSGLRRVLGAAGSPVDLETHRQGYRLAVSRDEVDLFRFHRLVGEGTVAVAAGRTQEGAGLLESALALWAGPALVEVAARDFAADAAQDAERRRLDALEALAMARMDLGDTAGGLQAAVEVVAADGLRERARGTLMLGLHRSGRTAEALRSYEEVRALLDEELGAVPSAELRDLHARILRHDESLLPPASSGRERASTRPHPDETVLVRRRSRPTLLLAAAAAAAVVVAAVAAVLGLAMGGPGGEHGDVTGKASRKAVLLSHGDGEVHLLVAQGFDRAVSDHALLARKIETGDLDATATLEEQVEPGAIVLDFTIDSDTAGVARRHPEASFVSIDDPEVKRVPNLATVRFSSHEAAFLAGVAAARTTRTGTVGFVGGVNSPVIWPFEAGFVAGVHAADPDMRVLVRYLERPPNYGGGFQDPALGERVGRRLYARGADVVFAAAGSSGLGVIEAATTDSTPDRKLWAIGVDADQYESVATLPGTVDVDGWRRHILTSVVIRFDEAVHDLMTQFVEGDFRPGLHRYDLANDGVGLAFSGGYLEELRDELEEMRRSIAGGAIAVPCRPLREAEPPDEGC